MNMDVLWRFTERARRGTFALRKRWRPNGEQGVELRQVISQPSGDWSGPTGRVQSLLDHIAPELKNPVALICGSQEVIDQTRSRLLNLGLAPEKILTNY